LFDACKNILFDITAYIIQVFPGNILRVKEWLTCNKR